MTVTQLLLAPFLFSCSSCSIYLKITLLETYIAKDIRCRCWPRNMFVSTKTLLWPSLLSPLVELLEGWDLLNQDAQQSRNLFSCWSPEDWIRTSCNFITYRWWMKSNRIILHVRIAVWLVWGHYHCEGCYVVICFNQVLITLLLSLGTGCGESSGAAGEQTFQSDWDTGTKVSRWS